MKTKAQLETEIKRLESEVKTLQKKFDYSQELVKKMRKDNINFQIEILKLRKLNIQLYTRKKSWLQRWLGI